MAQEVIYGGERRASAVHETRARVIKIEIMVGETMNVIYEGDNVVYEGDNVVYTTGI